MEEKEKYVIEEIDANVEIIMRDVNGKTRYVDTKWNDVSSINDFDECEILMVIVAVQVIYCALGSKPITWDDLRGYFA